ncbi:EAL domain-containing protein [Saccharophagus degradans]|uniref:EAL domain-containing protein n=1 Tax=Saccharophagus degradans TaxID=86304 RepID=A0AAW7XAI5_9GAMM|nr:EAL domain-containing protein [Saccharophagus degradans]MBU2987608.1 EAL domain-containing protein [Saccharophagus degradans]MDO6424667.1 EAL domain-containing protein [Saccharophagus degradans]MDO6609000.1 EAL domain-containing protein [Saccharophagus degradans]
MATVFSSTTGVIGQLPTNKQANDSSAKDSYFDLAGILDAMSGMVFLLDRWGVIQLANSLALKLCNGENPVGKNVMELDCGWQDASTCQRDILYVVRSGLAKRGSVENIFVEGQMRCYCVDIAPASKHAHSPVGVFLTLTDITHQEDSLRALRDSESRHRAFIASSADAIWAYELVPPVDISLPVNQQVDLIMRRALLTECNEKMARIYGVSDITSVVGRPIYLNGSMSNKEDIRRFVLNNYRVEDHEFTRIDRFGELGYMLSSAMGVIENGKLMRAWGSTRDVTDQRRYLDRMRYLANHDTLTSLPNRNLLYKELERVLSNRSQNQKVALLLVDLDRFKEINDTLGHQAGDKVLKQLGPRLEVELGDTPGMVARLGGDEFAILLSNIRNRQHAVVTAHRFADAIAERFDLDTFSTELQSSIGVVICPDQAEDVSTLMRYADVAMYHAKNNMKAVSIYDAEYDPNSAKRLTVTGALGRAIREEQLVLFYQPKVDLKTHRVYGFEALIRWIHPELGFIPPSDFVPMVELSSWIYPMTLWVLEQTIKQCAMWRDAGLDLTLAMNLSPRNLADDRIVNDLEVLLKKYNVRGGMLEMEITESMLMSDPNRASRILERINKLGVRLSIDDFGTGYSSLAYLKRLPVKTLKIDGSFIMNMLESEQDEIIVKSTIHLAHNLGLDVVAEGVETLEVYDRLNSLECDSVQGYYIAKPMPIESVGAWLADYQS